MGANWGQDWRCKCRLINMAFTRQNGCNVQPHDKLPRYRDANSVPFQSPPIRFESWSGKFGWEFEKSICIRSSVGLRMFLFSEVSCLDHCLLNDLWSFAAVDF